MLDRLAFIVFYQSKSLGDRPTLCWLGLALCLSLIYPYLALLHMLGNDYWIQDDARQHIFWMLRFIDPMLFPGDLIANYYQSIAPAGVKGLYGFFALFRIDPILLSKVIPFVLSSLTAFGAFALCLEILPVPFAGFLSSTCLLLNLWYQDGVASGTARAFLLPILLLFLWAIARKSRLWVATSVILLGLFYASFVLIAAGILVCQLFTFQDGRIALNPDQGDRRLAILGLAIAFVMLLPYAFDDSVFGPVITLAEAKRLPEFGPGGRASFFQNNWWDYLFNGSRTGIRITAALIPELAYGTLLLPIVLRYKHAFPLTASVRKLFVFNQLWLSGLAFYGLAQLLLFRLYLPSRYSLHSLRLVFTLLAGITVVVLLHKLYELSKTWGPPEIRVVPLGVALGFIAALVLIHPFLEPGFPHSGYRVGEQSALYEFLRQTPKETIIASLTAEADNLPSFGQRGVYVATEYGIPYHTGYYTEFRTRVQGLIAAHYSPSLRSLQTFIQESGVDLWLVNGQVFNPTAQSEDRWLNHFQPQAERAIAQMLENPEAIALWQTQQFCTIFREPPFALLNSQCILDLEDDSVPQ